MSDPEPPWRLLGEAVVCWLRVPADERRRLRASLPPGVRALPLMPAVVIGAAYQDSPVGEFHELSVAIVGRIGLRPGMHVVRQVVDSAEARRVFRSRWGLPTDLGTFLWSRDGDGRAIRWNERGVIVRAERGRLRIPMVVLLRSVQRRSDGPVVLPRRLAALARTARVTVEVAQPLSDQEIDVSWLAGRHFGVVLHGMRVVASEARQPAGALSSLRAPTLASRPAVEGQ